MLTFAELDSQLCAFPQVSPHASATAAGETRNMTTHYSAAVKLEDCNENWDRSATLNFVTQVSKSCSWKTFMELDCNEKLQFHVWT